MKPRAMVDRATEAQGKVQRPTKKASGKCSGLVPHDLWWPGKVLARTSP